MHPDPSVWSPDLRVYALSLKRMSSRMPDGLPFLSLFSPFFAGFASRHLLAVVQALGK